MIDWFGSIVRRKLIRADRKIEKRVRRFLERYLAADAAGKNQFYQVVAGAAAACQHSVRDPTLKNTELAHATSDFAFKVVQSRLQRCNAADFVQSMITDAYATVAIAHLRASAAYATDPEMQRLGTAAVHLVTMATSYMALMEYEG